MLVPIYFIGSAVPIFVWFPLPIPIPHTPLHLPPPTYLQPLLPDRTTTHPTKDPHK